MLTGMLTTLSSRMDFCSTLPAHQARFIPASFPSPAVLLEVFFSGSLQVNVAGLHRHNFLSAFSVLPLAPLQEAQFPSKKRPTPVICACVETVEFPSLTFPARLAFLLLPHFLFCQGWHLCRYAPSQIEQITLCFYSGSKRRMISVWNNSTHLPCLRCVVQIVLLLSKKLLLNY